MSEYGTTEYGTTPKTELTGVPFSDVKNCDLGKYPVYT